MSSSEAERQAANFTQPVAGYTLAITLDTTSRRYALTSLQMCTEGTTDLKETVYVTLSAESADCYYMFSASTALTLDETSTVAAGGTPALSTAVPDVVFAGTKEHVRWDRKKYPQLYLKGSAAGKVRIRVSSQPMPGRMNAG